MLAGQKVLVPGLAEGDGRDEELRHEAAILFQALFGAVLSQIPAFAFYLDKGLAGTFVVTIGGGF